MSSWAGKAQGDEPAAERSRPRQAEAREPQIATRRAAQQVMQGQSIVEQLSTDRSHLNQTLAWSPAAQRNLQVLQAGRKRVFSIDMERCPVCQQGRLRIIAAIMERSVIQKILRHLKLAVDPPPIAPAQQAAFAWAF